MPFRAPDAPLRAFAGLLVCAFLHLNVAVDARASTLDAAPVVVTASRLPEPLDRSLASVSVVTRTAIERSPTLSFDQLLATVPGVALTNNGGLGKATSVFVRGADADQTLVLIDGVPIGSTTLGTAALQDLPLELFERVEIVRGPRSSLYGSQAVGGVVQAFTRRAEPGAPLGVAGVVGAGDDSTRRASATASGGGEHVGWHVGASTLASAGTNACEGFGAPRFVGCFTDEPDRDAYRNTSGLVRLLGEWGALQTSALALVSAGRVEYDGSGANVAQFEQRTLGASARWQPTAGWAIGAAVGHATDDTDNERGGTRRSRFDTARDSASLTVDWRGDRGRVALGLDALRDRVDSTTRYVDDGTSAIGVYLTAGLAAGRHAFDASARRDDHARFGGHTTAAMAWGYDLASRWRVTTSYATGFRAPTLNELYFPGFGNATLGPETSRGLEASLRYASAAWRGRLTAFRTSVDDLIGFDARSRPVNVDRARLQGTELELAGTWRAVDLELGAEWLDAENRSAISNFGRRLPRRPDAIVRAALATDLGAVRLGTRARYEGARYDDLANRRRVGGFFVADFTAAWAVTQRVLAQGRLANAFDRRYATAAFYPQPGRTWFLELRYRESP